MRAVFNPAGLKRAFLVAVTVAASAKLVATVTGFFLPALPPVSVCAHAEREKPVRITLTAWQTVAAPATFKQKRPSVADESGMTGYRLLMTAVGKNGMVILSKNGGKGRVLRVGESLDGYRLESVFADRARFVRNGRSAWLYLKKSQTVLRSAPAAVKRVLPAAKPSVEKRYGELIQQEGDVCYVPKELLGEMHDLKKIFKRISIMPLRKGKKLEGFLVTRVAPGSVFEKIGFRPRDVIVAVDGKPLKSENDAMAYFGKLSDINTMELTVMRNHKKKVIRYEVY